VRLKRQSGAQGQPGQVRNLDDLEKEDRERRKEANAKPL